MSIFTRFKLTILHIRSLYSDLLTHLDNSDTLTIGFRSRMATLTKRLNRLHFSISQLFALLKFPISYKFLPYSSSRRCRNTQRNFILITHSEVAVAQLI
jgi:hypothetical protein